jgi:hypothetical protein
LTSRCTLLAITSTDFSFVLLCACLLLFSK